MNLVAMGIVALNIAVAVALYYGLNGRIPDHRPAAGYPWPA